MWQESTYHGNIKDIGRSQLGDIATLLAGQIIDLISFWLPSHVDSRRRRAAVRGALVLLIITNWNADFKDLPFSTHTLDLNIFTTPKIISLYCTVQVLCTTTLLHLNPLCLDRQRLALHLRNSAQALLQVRRRRPLQIIDII